MSLLQTIPYFGPPRYAVFADDEGNPVFEPLVAFGSYLINPEKDLKVLAGFALGEHPEPADFKPNFVGWHHGEYATDGAQCWADRCKAKRAELKAKEADSKKAKIIIPNQPTGIVGVHLKP